MKHFNSSTLFLLFLCLAICGCNSKPEATLIPASGTVTIDGEPAGDLQIQFMPDVMSENSGPTSTATSKADGTFTLKTYDGKDGAVPGVHKVTIYDLKEDRPAQGEEAKPPRIDQKYNVASTSLTITVKEGEEILLELESPY